MPYSAAKKALIKQQKENERAIKALLAEATVLTSTVENKTINTIYKEADKMFKTYVRCFYSTYDPTKYVRHDPLDVKKNQGNLFEANNITQDLEFNITTERMQSYPIHGKGWDDERILTTVLQGMRLEKHDNVVAWTQQFPWKYKSKYFEVANMSWYEAIEKLDDEDFSYDLYFNFFDKEIRKVTRKFEDKYPILRPIYEWGEK